MHNIFSECHSPNIDDEYKIFIISKSDWNRKIEIHILSSNRWLCHFMRFPYIVSNIRL